MDQPISKEESYEARRLLFKNIWQKSIDADEKEDISKPKVVKTVRLNEIDHSIAGQKKKQKIRNLRAVCNKILDFCDCQEEEMFNEQMTELVNSEKTPLKVPYTLRRRKLRRFRKKVKTKSLKQPTETHESNVSASDRKNKFETELLSKRTKFGSNKIPTVQHASISEDVEISCDGDDTTRVIAKKKRVIRKKKSLIRKSAEKYHRHELLKSEY